LGESRFIDVELDTGTKLDAMEVASAELIFDADLAAQSSPAAVRVELSDEAWMSATRSSAATRGSPVAARVKFAGGAQRAGGVWP
jgi:hypothetical protein